MRTRDFASGLSATRTGTRGEAGRVREDTDGPEQAQGDGLEGFLRMKKAP